MGKVKLSEGSVIVDITLAGKEGEAALKLKPDKQDELLKKVVREYMDKAEIEIAQKTTSEGGGIKAKAIWTPKK
jgi:hypothetical protein